MTTSSSPVLDFLLHGLDHSTFIGLLSCKWSCTCIFRVLHPIARAIVMSAVGDGGTFVELNHRDGLAERRSALDMLVELGLMQGGPSAQHQITSSSSSSLSAFATAVPTLSTSETTRHVYTLHKEFETNIRDMLVAENTTPFRILAMTGRQVNCEQHAKMKFTQRLKYVIQPHRQQHNQRDEAVTAIERLFEHDMKLVNHPDGANHGSNAKITRHGLSFMLLSVHDQVWSIIQALAKKSAGEGHDPTHILRALFRLSFCTFGTRYGIEPGDSDFENVKHILHELGLILIDHASSFVPTSLGVYGVFKPVALGGNTLVQAGLVAEGSRFSEMKIIVETTMSIFAFVDPNADTDIQCRLLELFVEVQYVLPGVIVGLLTRESVQGAISKGIRATQLIDFLTQNAHDRVLEERSKGMHLVPQNVSDQLILWGSERSRLVFSDGFVVDGFKDRKLFDMVLDFCRRNEHALWFNNDPVQLEMCGVFVREQGMADLREFIGEARKELSAVGGGDVR